MRRRALSKSDEALWTAFASRIAPLPGRPPVVEPATAEIARAAPPPPPVTQRTQKAAPRAGPVAVGDQPGGLDSSTWHRFRSGKLVAARKLDLHGMTVQTAFHRLVPFLRSAHADGVRCVEVVTGRGSGENGGAIRREFPHWLNLPEIRPMILGAAHPHALNPGSVRLILRRLR